MHGQFDGTIEADVENSKLIVNGQAIRITAERNPADLKWNEVEAEYVVESTGLFLSKDKAQAHIEAGAKYVVMSAPSKDDTPMFVCGVNEKTYVKGTQFVSNASCKILEMIESILNKDGHLVTKVSNPLKINMEELHRYENSPRAAFTSPTTRTAIPNWAKCRKPVSSACCSTNGSRN